MTRVLWNERDVAFPGGKRLLLCALPGAAWAVRLKDANGRMTPLGRYTDKSVADDRFIHELMRAANGHYMTPAVVGEYVRVSAGGLSAVPEGALRAELAQRRRATAAQSAEDRVLVAAG